MHFLVYSRAVPEREFPEYTAEDEEALNERHWSYIDRFSEAMIARGPTSGPTRDAWTGSVHIVDLPDYETARAFVENEPYQRTGLFAEHSVWRFSDRLGRTMWEYAAATDVPVGDLDPRWRKALVVYGALSTLDGAPDGMAAAVQVPSRDVLDTLMAEPSIGLSNYSEVEVHDWEFGGRR
jgi:uncharacterized protein YciI